MTHAIIDRFATTEPTLCSVCRRHAWSVGYAPPNCWRPPIIWLCDSNDCHAAAKKVYAMPPRILDAYELGSMLEAGREAAGYLETIGKTDLAALDDGQWREFLRRLLVGYEQALRRKILNNEPPF